MNSSSAFRVPARRAKKRLGQHFLRDPRTVTRIVDFAALETDEEVLEIGPGEGVLTTALLARGARVTAVETDRDLWEPLSRRLREAGREQTFNLVEGDFLKLDLEALLADRAPLAVVANIPYQITTPILFRLIRERHLFSRAVLMMQEEVAARLLAAPGSKEYGRLTVGVSLYCELTSGFRVPPGAFSPPPKVFSRVVRLDFRSEPRYPVKDYRLLERLLLVLFSQRRKQIINPLKGMLPHLERDELAERLRRAGFSPETRPALLSVAELVRLADCLEEWK